MTPSKISGLYTLIETAGRPDIDPFECARSFLRGGAKIVQLRQKGRPPSERLDLARRISALKKEFEFTYLINDSIDIALQVSADGVHLGQNDQSIASARKIIGPDKIIGRSTHSLKEAIQAVEEGADYIALGAIFPTTSKPKGHIVVGVDVLKEVIQKIPIPVVAIGGISRSNIGQVLETGVASIAMISALTDVPPIEAETRWFVSFLESFRRNR